MTSSTPASPCPSRCVRSVTSIRVSKSAERSVIRPTMAISGASREPMPSEVKISWNITAKAQKSISNEYSSPENCSGAM